MSCTAEPANTHHVNLEKEYGDGERTSRSVESTRWRISLTWGTNSECEAGEAAKLARANAHDRFAFVFALHHTIINNNEETK